MLRNVDGSTPIPRRIDSISGLRTSFENDSIFDPNETINEFLPFFSSVFEREKTEGVFSNVVPTNDLRIDAVSSATWASWLPTRTTARTWKCVRTTTAAGKELGPLA
jgi:hypothetical protein